MEDLQSREHPVSSSSDWLRAHAEVDRLRCTQPMIASNEADLIISNCVLNLVAPAARPQLFAEMSRVLRAAGL